MPSIHLLQVCYCLDAVLARLTKNIGILLTRHSLDAVIKFITCEHLKAWGVR